ncbi:AAA family ATPase [Bradyrhizobium genosp. A]|uniref:AAA family ATPase n=1 Tax=Bradyrhizobium genosp. A TaxID=83626 RepID=UPI003CEB9CFE
MATPSYPLGMDMLHFGQFRLDRAGYSLIRNGSDGQDHRVDLRRKAFDVLRYLVEHAGRIVSPDEFLNALWPDTYVQPEVLKGHVLAVRTALGDRATPAVYIETVRGRGYRFIAEVRPTPPVQLEGPAAPELLVGRTTARAELDLAMQRTRLSEMQIVFLTGEAGIGKTALARVFVESAKDDVTVVTAHCLPGSGETDAYYPILEILAGLSRSPAHAHLAAVLRELAPTWLMQLPHLMPADASELRNEVVGATPHRMARELCDALEALTQNKFLLLLLEDVQWADQATLDLIQALANRRPRTQLLIIATLRSPAEAGYSASTLAQKLSLYRLAREIKLLPLELSDVEAFLSSFVHANPPAELTRHLHRRSEGNPLFMRAMLDYLVQRNLIAWDEDGWRMDGQFEAASFQVSPDLLQLIEAEIHGLAAEAQNVLEAASLSDGPFAPHIYHVASDVDERSYETVCETLARRGQLIQRSDIVEMPDGGLVQTYSFRHALFQEVVYERQGSVRRAAQHAAVAFRLETLFSADLAPMAPSIARHYIQSWRWPQAIHFLRLASRTAMRRFAMREAAALLEQATELSRNLPAAECKGVELDLLDELTKVYLGAFDKRAFEAYGRLYELARDVGRVDVEVRALLGLGYITSTINSDRCLEIMSQALARSADIADPVQRGRVRCVAHGWRNWILGGSPAEAAGFEAAINDLSRLGNPLVLAASEFDRGLILLPAARYTDAIETVSRNLAILAEHALEAQVDIGFPLWTSRLGIPWGLMSLGRFGEAISMSESACAAIEANGDIIRSATLRLYRAFMYEQMHDHQTALTVLDEAVALIANNGLEFPTNEVKVELVIRGLANLGLGRLEVAFKNLTAARADMDARNTLTSWYWRVVAKWGMTDAHLVAGELDAAEVCAKAFLERACTMEERSWQGLAAESCARVELALGRPSSAAKYLAQAWSQIEGYEAGLVRWRLHSVGATISDLTGESLVAARHRKAQAEELDALAASLPLGHAGRATLRAAQPLAPRGADWPAAASPAR